MQIVWDKEAAEKLKNSHTLLELETFDVNGTPLTAHCIIPPEKLITDIANLENLRELHSGFIDAMNKQNFTLCKDISEHLIGRFGGELDSFYEEILSRNTKAE